MSCFVLDVQPRVMTMHREARVTKHGSNEYRFLVGREVDVERPTSLGVIRVHDRSMDFGCDTDVHRYSWFKQQPRG